MHRRGTLLSAVMLVAATAVFYAADSPKLPPPYATRSVRNGPRVISQPEGAKLTLPAGFRMEVWAQGFKRPRYMILGPSNEVIMADAAARPDGTIYVFEGKEPKKLIGGLYQPYGLAYQNGYLYVGESDSVKRYKYDART